MGFYCMATTQFQFGYYWPKSNFNSKHYLKLAQMRLHGGGVGLYLSFSGFVTNWHTFYV